MQRKFKDWLRKTNPHQKGSNAAQRAEGTRTIFIPRKEGTGSSPSLQLAKSNKTDRNAVSERSSGSNSNSGSRTGPSPTTSKEPRSAYPTNSSEDGDYYHAYLSSLKSGGTSLGRDSSLTNTHTSVRNYNEDIADRNIEEHPRGYDSPRTSSTYNADTLEDVEGRPSLRRDSTRRSPLGSIGGGSLSAEELFQVEQDSADEQGTRERYKPNRSKWPVRTPRDEARMGLRTRRGSGDSTDDDAPHPGDYGPRVQRPSLKGRRSSSTGNHSIQLRHVSRPRDVYDQDGVADLGYSEDVDGTTQWAPAVTHEHVSRPTHNYVTEFIHRDIHTHDVYHHIQPVIDTEVLLPKHYIPSPDDPSRLIEVSPSAIPLNSHERWFIGDREIEPPRKAAATDPTFASTSPDSNARSVADSGSESSLQPASSPTTASTLPKPVRKPVSSAFQAHTNIAPSSSSGTGTGTNSTERKDSIMTHPSTLKRFTSPNNLSSSFDSDSSDDDEANNMYVDANESRRYSDALDCVPDISHLTLREVLDSTPAVDGCRGEFRGGKGIGQRGADLVGVPAQT